MIIYLYQFVYNLWLIYENKCYHKLNSTTDKKNKKANIRASLWVSLTW